MASGAHTVASTVADDQHQKERANEFDQVVPHESSSRVSV